MSIKILGKKYYDNNQYNKIIVDNRNDFITLKADGGYVKEKGGRIIKNIENLPELEQVEYVIDTYVNDNIIRQIDYKKDLKCKSTNDKELVFKSYMSSFTKEFIKKIYQKIFYKYNNDRKKYLKENRKEKYKITTKDFNSKYEMTDDVISLIIATDKGILEESEEKFLKEFLFEMFSLSNGNIEIQKYRWNEFKMSIPCLNIIIDDILIECETNESVKKAVSDVYDYYKMNRKERGK